MWDFIRQNSFVVGALSGSLAAYLLGLIVAHLRREKKWIAYSVTSQYISIAGNPKLTMKYEARDIQRLDWHTVMLRNVGNKALKEIPIIVGFRGQILEHEISGPADAKFKGDVNENILTVTCDLLNPKEMLTVGLAVADASLDEIRVNARAENLQVRRLVSSSFWSEAFSGPTASEQLWAAIRRRWKASGH